MTDDTIVQAVQEHVDRLIHDRLVPRPEQYLVVLPEVSLIGSYLIITATIDEPGRTRCIGYEPSIVEYRAYDLVDPGMVARVESDVASWLRQADDPEFVRKVVEHNLRRSKRYPVWGH